MPAGSPACSASSTPHQLIELKDLVDGRSFPDLARDLLNACDADAQIETAKQQFGTWQPSEEQVTQATGQLVQAALTPLLKAAFRRRILEIRQQNEQTIDRHTIDDVLYSGFDASAVAKAQNKVQDLRCCNESPWNRGPSGLRAMAQQSGRELASAVQATRKGDG